jgi:hypothetical protein
MLSPRRLVELPWAVRRNVSFTFNHGLIRQHSSDQYIAAFPRSGSTWLRTILCGIIDPEKGFEPDVFNRLIPSVGIINLPLIWKLPDPRIMFTHAPFRRGLRRVVYVVRDGRDSLVSFYHKEFTREGVAITFPEFFSLYNMRRFGPRWHDNVESWLTQGKEYLGDNLLIAKFEDLKKTPVPLIREIAKFLDIRADESAISHALEAASLENAREREKRENRRLDNPNASFYRGGKTGQWQEYMDDAIYAKFMKMSERAFSLAGYSE